MTPQQKLPKRIGRGRIDAEAKVAPAERKFDARFNLLMVLAALAAVICCSLLVQ